ncbi:hypothetical protein [Variovorax sp. N23]|uniref:hypothetical protein n=1 Tax=Variovorax sp. N23 TaxID=2980555 RepID=UPI0021C9C054|nr:hypothetical protein [Variovorax sp. N23]MCU4119742.1 hypothetical protein [Variovorax sp. N23]
MLDLLNIVYLGAILFSSITLYPQGETLVPTVKDSFVEMSFNREWWRDDGNGKCEFTGVLVPYTRTWPEEIQRGGETVVLPPEPDVIVGYVAVVTRKACKGKDPEPILRAGLPVTRKQFFKERMVDKTSHFPAGDMLDTPTDKVPPWFAQAVNRMELMAEKNEAAKRFLAASTIELSKALPLRSTSVREVPLSFEAARSEPSVESKTD